MKVIIWCLLAGSLFLHVPAAVGEDHSRFRRVVLSESFDSEGADAADIDGDGNLDVVSGPYWYAGPDFRERHTYAIEKRNSIKGYSNHFFSFARDVDQDGWKDVISIPIPGAAAVWHRNPGDVSTGDLWDVFPVMESVDNESPTMADMDGDGRQELVCIHKGRYGYAQPDPSDPTQPWKFIPITDDRGYGRFTHGLGVGDVDGDGRQDLLEKEGWWRQGSASGEPFQFHPVKFAQSGGAQMFAYDFDGDGDNDVLSVQNAHGHGLCWFERRGADEVTFLRHVLCDESESSNPFGVSLTQMHAVALADIDGDGVKDIVTGKRYWAHGGNDPGASRLPILLWFRTSRSRLGLQFVPHLINLRVGVGTQLTATDLDADGRTDLVVGNKLGTTVLLNTGHQQAAFRPDQIPAMAAGSDEFKTAVRNTEPLSPEEERQNFVVPAGFEVQLVAAEPDIAKPMNLAFDARGRLWVSSSLEYPFPAEEGKGRDTIKILEDTDGDGQADKIQTFADGLNIPMGLYPYKDGVVCYSIPNIWHLRDTDGDGRCDQRDILYGPFDYSRDTHGMCNGFTRGFDGWLYACHGFNNQSSVSGRDGNRVEMQSGNTFRMKLDGSRIEHFTHGQVNPFGMALNPEGDLFTADCHTKPVSLLLRGGYYQSFGKPHDGLGYVPDVMEHLHGSTAIGGIALYHGQSFPPVYQGNAFGGNVMTSRINRNALEQIGGTLRAREEPDFLVSGDPWFRPVDLQVGPDGALYVADFYNRIIGHYEVGLDHPGRDRHRGRIWRIVFKDPSQRRDVAEKSDDSFINPDRNLRSVFEQIRSDNLTERLLATDRLADTNLEERDAVIKAVRQASVNENKATTRTHLLWVLHRLQHLNQRELVNACRDDEPLVRSHAYQMIAAGADTGDAIESVLIEGVRDSDGRVQRSASLAAAQHFTVDLAIEMLRTLRRVSASDPHLAAVLQMSLRDQLRQHDHFSTVTAALPAENREQLIDLCLGIKTAFAGEYVAENLDELVDLSQEKLTDYLTFAAQYASPVALPTLIELVQRKFPNDLGFQERLAKSVRDGLVSRGVGSSLELNQWVGQIVRKYLGMNPGDTAAPIPTRSIAWTYSPVEGQLDQANPFVLSTRRSSSDGQSNSRLHSSFPTGESKVGRYRSDSFKLPEQFSFFLAGHDGVPPRPLQNRNYVQVRDSRTLAVLKRFSPPRNDTAQRMDWATKKHAGKHVDVELVDGDDGNAYAWLAAGRFSIPGLNPSRQADQIGKAAELVQQFDLHEMRGLLSGLLSDGKLGRGASHAVAMSIASLSGDSGRAALADSIAFAGVDDSMRNDLIAVIRSGDEGLEKELGRVMKVLAAAEQRKVASHLATDTHGVKLLIGLVRSGAASPRLLVDPELKNRVDSIVTDDERAAIAELVGDLPAEENVIAEVMNRRKSHYLSHESAAGSGQELFSKHCSVCHQVAGKGQVVGPNLDGIGNRGIERLIEDVLVPNRNVDEAFRASVVLTEDGRVVSGLLQQAGGNRWRLVDQSGKEFLLHENDISRRERVKTSPMPANVHQILDEQQTTDLLRYLLSLTT